MTTNAVRRRVRVGIDVGGTFTDIVVGDLESGTLLNYKEPSTPADPALGVISGLRAAMVRFALAPNDLAAVVHGTTIGLNAILQRNGARLALVVSNGNRDILEIARGSMPSPYDMYAQKDLPLVPRDLVFECGARGRTDGSVGEFPTSTELDFLAARLRGTEVESVAIAILHSYANPDVEHRLVEELSSRLPDLRFTASSDIWPEIREYERCLVACLNASILTLMQGYFERLQLGFRNLGIDCPIFISTSNGGCISVEAARRRPIDTVLSGPASGVVAATALAEALPNRNIVTVDMGGTSADMSVCEQGLPQTTTSAHIGEFPLVTPVVGVSAIGTGGGSVLWVDLQGLLKVGPESAGANPGPVCFRRGGEKPTLTDCYVALGFIDPKHFLGGRMELDRASAVAALEELGDRLGFTGSDAAERVASAGVRIATAKMVGELLKGLARRGANPQDYVLVPFGGAGPTNAVMLAEESRINKLVIPRAPGLFCALGALMSDVRRDFVRSLPRFPKPNLEDELRGTFGELTKGALDWLRSEDNASSACELRYSADMRYAGQAYDIEVTLSEDLAAAGDVTGSLNVFHAEHHRVHGFSDETVPVEIRNLRVVAVEHTAKPPAEESVPPQAGRQPARRAVFIMDGWIEATVQERSNLQPGHVVPGPAILEQDDTTIVVLPGWQAKACSAGHLDIWKET